MTYLRRYSPTKLCDSAQMATFRRAACSTFQTCILNSRYGHTMCGSMVDIQSATPEIRRGKKRRKKKRDKNIMSASATQGAIITKVAAADVLTAQMVCTQSQKLSLPAILGSRAQQVWKDAHRCILNADSDERYD